MSIVESILRALATFSIIFALPVYANENSPLRNVSEVLSIDPEVSKKGLSVEFEGQILWKNGKDHSFFLQSEDQGIYVNCDGFTLSRVHLIGDRVRVYGVTHEGKYSIAVQPRKIEHLSAAPLPESRPFQVAEIWSTTNDCDWVNFTARPFEISIIEAREVSETLIVLKTYFEGQTLRVEIPWSESVEKELRGLLFLPVTFFAVAGTQYNNDRQIVGRVMHVTEFRRTTEIQEQTAEAYLAPKSIHELSRVRSNFDKFCRTHGVVIHYDERYLYLRGEQSCIRVSIREQVRVSIGDRVELGGFVKPGRFGPTFLARELRVIDSVGKPAPIQAKVPEILPKRWFRVLSSQLHNELIQLEAQLVETSTWVASTGKIKEHHLLCRQGDHLFEVILSSIPTIPEEWESGATLRMTGICCLEVTEDATAQLDADQFSLLARSLADIELLEAAPWWTKEKLYALAATTFALGAAFFLWVLSLRKVVARQLETIADQIEKESVLNERQRIARDLHDTLEQGLSALTMQLKIVHRKLTKKLPDELYAIEAAEKMLAACSRESRGAIEDMRGGPWETMDLPEAIREVIGSRVKNAEIQFELVVPQIIDRLSPFAEQQITRLLSEAAANALEHAEPNIIKIELNQDGEKLEIKVSDDGYGFDLEAAKKSGRFGILGMYERANRLNTSLTINSAIGKGTRIYIAISISDFPKKGL